MPSDRIATPPSAIATSSPPVVNVPPNTSLRPRAVMSMKPPTPAVRYGRFASFETLTLPARSICRNDTNAQSNPAPWKKVNCCGEGMMASALSAQPKAKPVTGTPPTGPCSIAQVTCAVQLFLEEDARHQGRDAEAERRDVAGGQLHRRAPRDHLLDAERLGLQRAEIDPDLAGQRRIVGRLGRLHLVRIDHHDVDQGAGHMHLRGSAAGPRSRAA